MPKVCLDPAKVKAQSVIAYVLAEMKKQKVTYKQMGDELGITQQGFSRRIECQNISVEDLIRMCTRLNIESSTLSELLRG